MFKYFLNTFFRDKKPENMIYSSYHTVYIMQFLYNIVDIS